MTRVRGGDAGFTLVEVVVALALFALIAAAGAALVTTMLDAQRHTAGRLDRLADLERAMAVVTRDLTEIADAPLAGGDGAIAFARHRGSREAGSGAAAVRYAAADGKLERIVDGHRQVLLDGVTAVRWHFYAHTGSWQDQWPAERAQAPTWPAAVAVDLELRGAPPTGRLRRVVDLPVRPLPPLAAVSQVSVRTTAP